VTQLARKNFADLEIRKKVDLRVFCRKMGVDFKTMMDSQQIPKLAP